MWGYWGKVAKRAAREAAAAASLGTADRVIASLLVQVLIAVGIYIALGSTALEDAAAQRILIAAAPFLTIPLLFLVKLATVPAAMHAELQRSEDTDRQWHLHNLVQRYTQDLSVENHFNIQHGLAYPPAEWVNEQLAALGFDWRVEFHPGAKVIFLEA